MKNKEFRMLQLFAAETGTTTAADLAPAISVDFTSRIAQNIVELQQLLGITDLVPMAAGTDIKIYKWTVDDLADQVGEGEKPHHTLCLWQESVEELDCGEGQGRDDRDACEHPEVEPDPPLQAYACRVGHGEDGVRPRCDRHHDEVEQVVGHQSFMQRWTLAVLKVRGRARMLGCCSVYFLIASASASSIVALVLKPMALA